MKGIYVTPIRQKKRQKLKQCLYSVQLKSARIYESDVIERAIKIASGALLCSKSGHC